MRNREPKESKVLTQTHGGGAIGKRYIKVLSSSIKLCVHACIRVVVDAALIPRTQNTQTQEAVIQSSCILSFSNNSTFLGCNNSMSVVKL